jgi:hypothetical protein
MEIPGIEPGDDTGQPDEAGCTWCERGSGMILLVGALGLAYIGLDLLTGGWLSRAFVGGVTRAADAIDVEGQAGELGGEAVTGEPGA